MLRTVALISLLIATSSMAAPPSGATSKPTTVDGLISKGQETAKAFADGTARFSWTTRLLTQGATFEVSNVVSGAKAKRTIRVVPDDGKTEEVLSVLEVGGAWYVYELGKPLGKYRPFEAPLGIPNAYFYLAAGDMKFLSAGTGATVQSVARDVAIVRIPLAGPVRDRIQSSIGAMQDLIKKLGDQSVAEKHKDKLKELQQKITELEQTVRDGQLVGVDINTGVILSNTFAAIKQDVIALSTKAAVVEKDFAIPAEKWKDFTDDPTKVKDPNDLLMISNSPWADLNNGRQFWQTFDGCLVNLSTKQVRRIPFNGMSCLSGCFSRDRRKVYVSGMDVEAAGLSIYEIDLSTGENNRIGKGELPDGLAMGPVLSADGTKLAVVMLSPNLMSQVYVLNLKTGKASKLGQPMDTAYLSWLDDGKGLILVSRKTVSMDKPTEDSVARMDLDGKVTILTRGGSPVLIPGRKKILFEHSDGWKTCDLDGKNVELYVGGMKGYGFPAVSADGKRIFWTQYEKGKGQMPKPMIQEYGKAEVSHMDLGRGLWTAPAWR